MKIRKCSFLALSILALLLMNLGCFHLGRQTLLLEQRKADLLFFSQLFNNMLEEDYEACMHQVGFHLYNTVVELHSRRARYLDFLTKTPKDFESKLTLATQAVSGFVDEYNGEMERVIREANTAE